MSNLITKIKTIKQAINFPVRDQIGRVTVSQESFCPSLTAFKSST